MPNPTRFVLLLTMTIFSFAAASCIPENKSSPSTSDPVARVAQRFHVPKKKVIELAQTLGVDPKEIERFKTDSYFPSNFYADQLIVADESKRLRRSGVLTFVKGFSAMCREDNTLNHSLLYFFYSAELVQPANEIPLLMQITFKQPVGVDDPDPRVGYIRVIDLSEPEVNRSGHRAFLDCIKERGMFAPPLK